VKRYVLRQTQTVPCPLEKVFPYFEHPQNLEAMTPSSLKMEIITPPPIEMRKGALFDYIVKVRGLPMRWTTLITHYDPPHRFIDVQLRGPYAYWHHTHTFEARGAHTVLTDEVVYMMPFGPFGQLAHALFVKYDLANIFKFRRSVVEQQFGVVDEV